jgi:hypothetical protein
MKNISTGFGLCVAATAALAYPFVSNLAPSANASAVTAAASSISNAATAQAGPTIVWYGISPASSSQTAALMGAMFRAWSDGRIEYKPFFPSGPYSSGACDLYLGAPPGCGWRLFSDPAQGLTYRSDINFDAKVDGADLGQLLADWGDAPRQDIPPSDCPLALINP